MSNTDFSKYGICVPDILLPNEQVDLKKWAVVACDQFTQDKSYWKSVEYETKNVPSTMHIILPEVFLNQENISERIQKINTEMKKYADDSSGIFAQSLHGFVYVERKTAYNRTRKGLVCAVDLETYDWKPYAKALIRATEQTIVDRLPPRIRIRQHAVLDVPHIMLLVNDPQKQFIEAAGDFVKNKKPLYKTDLLFDSGSITGWAVHDEDSFEHIEHSLQKLAELNVPKDANSQKSMLFAVGDGNHSLAAAKAVWNEYKTAHNVCEHPLRYALVELVNLYDDGLTFEPIHRVLFNADIPLLIKYITAELNSNTTEVADAGILQQLLQASDGFLGLVYTDSNAKTHYVLFQAEYADLPVSYIQPILDAYMSVISETSIDFIHGSHEVFRLGKNAHTASLLLPPIEKENFFATLYTCGVLPRKSFSMGEASEKRFYMETRKLI